MPLRDRGTIVDKAYHRDVWKTVGGPGAILSDGEIVGTWRPRESGRKPRIEFKAVVALGRDALEALAAEAERIAPLRGTSSVSVEITSY